MSGQQVVRCVFYLRASTSRQETSVPDQREHLRKLASDRGYVVIREYVDDGLSGDDTERRAGFRRLIEDAVRLADFDRVLCWDQSRFGRFDPLEAGYWVKPLRDARVRLETAAEGLIDWETFAGRLMYTVSQEGKHAFLRDMSRATARGMLAKAKQGGWLGGKAPYGYRLNTQTERLEPGDPDEVEAVRWMFRTYGDGLASLGDLVRELNARGVPSPGEVERRAGKHRDRRTGLLWSKTAVHKILTRPAYLGHSVWNRRHVGSYHTVRDQSVAPSGKRRKGTVIPNDAAEWITVEGTHPALVDRPTFDRVQQRLIENRDQSTPKRSGLTYLFTGLVRCGHCGWPMHGISNRYNGKSGDTRRYKKYMCGNYNLHGQAGCRCNTVKERALIRAVLRGLRDSFLAPTNLDRLRSEVARQVEADRAGRPDPAAALDARIAELDRQIAEGAKKWLTAPPALIGEIGQALEQLKQELERLRAEHRGVSRPAPSLPEFDRTAEAIRVTVEGLSERLDDADPTFLKEFVRQAVERVDLWFDHVPYGQSRFKSVVARGQVQLREGLIVSRPVPLASPETTVHPVAASPAAIRSATRWP